jgi:hypothetical protein
MVFVYSATGANLVNRGFASAAGAYLGKRAASGAGGIERGFNRPSVEGYRHLHGPVWSSPSRVQIAHCFGATDSGDGEPDLGGEGRCLGAGIAFHQGRTVNLPVDAAVQGLLIAIM